MSAKNGDALEFDLVGEDVPVKIKDKDGVEKAYYLREIDGAARDAYMSFVMGKMRTDGQGRAAGLKDYERYESALLAKCLYDATTNTLVPENIIRGWRSSIQRALFKKAEKMNGLDTEAEVAAKND